MPYQVRSNVDGRPRLTLTGEPSYCHAFDGTPPEETRHGAWLIMDFAVWSVPDVEAVQTALDAARHFDGSLNLGLIPYYDDDSDNPSPHWVLLRNGAVEWRHNGTLNLDELISLISAT